MPAPTAFDAAVAARSPLLDVGLVGEAHAGAAHAGAFRLFNGHLEGDPRYVIDVYATTAVIYRHAPAPDGDDAELATVIERLRASVPWLASAVVKEREGETDEARRGRVVALAPGAPAPATEVREHGVRYAVDLLMNQDAGFYLDTRLLRRWLIDESEGSSVLNTFAYTGSLGVAARAGGAARVVHTDLSARFLDVAKASYALNGFAVERADFQARDFFSFVRGARLRGDRFDTVVLDPPPFSTTRGGTVDLSRNTVQLINKVRPLVRSGGRLVVVNNALYLSGADFVRELEALCAGGWMEMERTIGVPGDVTGYPGTRVAAPPVDPAPFDHTTKIAVLTVRHR